MLSINFSKMNNKLLLAFLLMSLIPLLVFAVIAIGRSEAGLEKQAFNQLEAVRAIKKAQISGFFAERKGDMGVLMEMVDVFRAEAFAKLEAVQALKKAQLTDYISEMKGSLNLLKDDPSVRKGLYEFKLAYTAASNKADGDAWQTAADTYGPRIKNIVKHHGWYDLFLLNPQGHIIYTDARESDLGLVANAGSLKNSSMADVFNAAKKLKRNEIAVADFKPYGPSNGDPAGFMMTKVWTDSGQLAGYLALQFPLDKINEIMLRRDGMGVTGESYLVGKDLLMRSDSFLDPQGHSVVASFLQGNKADTSAVRAALAGKADTGVIIDYNNNPVLSRWDPIDIGSGIRWALLSEVDVAEAFSPMNSEGKDFYAQYMDQYGYYDLFLMNPDGYVFYSVTREADYQTNMLKGAYSSSNLGQLTQQVLSTKQYGVADFAPYAPSNNEPAAFIAQPVLSGSGEPVLVVALQLSLGAINNIMQQREGMGETGESYLVGADHLMRSDSFLDPEGHSVKASFAGNVKDNGIDSVAARNALAGQTASEIVIDYNGNPVLSSYSPLAVGEFTWALLVEIDEAEAFKVIAELIWISTIICLVAAAVIAVLALIQARNISTPLVELASVAGKIADGDLTQKIKTDKNPKGEVGMLQRAIEAMVIKLKNTVEQINQSAVQQASAAHELSITADEMIARVERQHSSTEQVASAMSEMNSTVHEVSRNTSEAATFAATARDKVSESNTVVQQTSEGIHRLADEMNSTMSLIQELETGAEDIGSILDVIKSIAEQTNLLALNAAIEAARAGDQGRGFAVVADEVRALAQSTQNSAGEIETVIVKLQEGATSSVEAMKVGAEQASKIVEQAQKVTVSLDETKEAVEHISDMNIQIATAAEEQSSVADEISRNTTEIRDISEETSVSAQKISEASGELENLSADLSAQIKQFKL